MTEVIDRCLCYQRNDQATLGTQASYWIFLDCINAILHGFLEDIEAKFMLCHTMTTYSR